MLNLVKVNFPQLKANNHKFLELYMDLFLENTLQVKILLWIKFGIHLVFTGLLFCWMHSYFQRKVGKSKEVYDLFALITKKNSEELKQYFSDTCIYFKSITMPSKKEKEVGNSKMIV